MKLERMFDEAKLKRESSRIVPAPTIDLKMGDKVIVAKGESLSLAQIRERLTAAMPKYPNLVEEALLVHRKAWEKSQGQPASK